MGVELNAAFHHQRPGDQRAMRRGPRAVALVGAHVGDLCAERLAPPHGIALVAGVAGVGGVGDFGNILLHHRTVAAVAIAGEDQGITADLFGRSIRAREPNPADATGAFCIGEQRGDMRCAEQGDAGARRRLGEAAHQPGTGFFCHGMHARHTVAGIEKPFEYLKLNAVLVRKPFERRARCRTHGARDCRVGTAMVLAGDITGEEFDRVANEWIGGAARIFSRSLLPACPASGDQARRQGRRAGGQRIALQHHAFDTGIGQRECGGHAAGTAANDQHARGGRKCVWGVKNHETPFRLRVNGLRPSSWRPKSTARANKAASLRILNFSTRCVGVCGRLSTNTT